MNSPDENAALPVRGSEAAALVQWLLSEARTAKVLKQMQAEPQGLMSTL